LIGLPLLSVYKDGGKAEKIKEERKKERNKKCTSSVRCYFVRTESGWDRGVPYILSNRTIGDARKIFMHIHTVPSVAKYLARLAILFTSLTQYLVSKYCALAFCIGAWSAYKVTEKRCHIVKTCSLISFDDTFCKFLVDRLFCKCYCRWTITTPFTREMNTGCCSAFHHCLCLKSQSRFAC
jgi:hypothetical protein